MTTQAHPLEIYWRFQSYLLGGEFGRLGEVVDMDGYTENCVGLTGWTTGLMTIRCSPWWTRATCPDTSKPTTAASSGWWPRA